MSQSTCCIECGRPWGVILERGELPTEESHRLAQLAMEEELMDQLDEGSSHIFSLENVPEVEADEIIFVTQSLGAFASEHLGSYIGDVPAWYPISDLDIPAWLLKGRRRRWAYRWECCTLDLDRFVVSPTNVMAVAR